MSPSDRSDALAFASGTLMSMIVFIMISVSNGCTRESQIVLHHAGHYEMDPMTGNSAFHWNDEPKKDSIPGPSTP